MLQKTKNKIAVAMIILLILAIGLILFFTLRQDTGRYVNARYVKWIWNFGCV